MPNRLYRYLNGLDQDSHDKRAEHIMQQSFDGLTIGPTNRNSVKKMLANHFESVEAATIERCVNRIMEFSDLTLDQKINITAAIRALKHIKEGN